ncbi:hypothetical protein REC12_11120 [Desulfosporosinus sp. PR]|nr:hypothetical protein [Desulfosporosinus sp. PR]
MAFGFILDYFRGLERKKGVLVEVSKKRGLSKRINIRGDWNGSLLDDLASGVCRKEIVIPPTKKVKL